MRLSAGPPSRRSDLSSDRRRARRPDGEALLPCHGLPCQADLCCGRPPSGMGTRSRPRITAWNAGNRSQAGGLAHGWARLAFPSASGSGPNKVPVRLGRRGQSHVRGEKGVSKNPQPSAAARIGTVSCKRLRTPHGGGSAGGSAAGFARPTGRNCAALIPRRSALPRLSARPLPQVLAPQCPAIPSGPSPSFRRPSARGLRFGTGGGAP